MNQNDPIRARRQRADTPKMREVYRYNAAHADAAAAIAERRYEVILDQRDRLADRLRFGALSINAASLFALGAVVGDQKKLTSLGLGREVVIVAAMLFLLGVLLSAIGLRQASWHMIGQVPKAFQRMLDSRHERALMDATCSDDAEQRFSETIANKKAEGDPDYAWSPQADAFTNWSGGAWVGGVTTLLISMVTVMF
ncbi:MAG: hypothetical protein ACREBO_09140 [Novosphingobium sp.]